MPPALNIHVYTTHNAVVADQVVTCQGCPQPNVGGHGEGKDSQEGTPVHSGVRRGAWREQQLQASDRTELGI